MSRRRQQREARTTEKAAQPVRGRLVRLVVVLALLPGAVLAVMRGSDEERAE